MSSRIWLVVGDRVGDNRQAESLAAALDLPFERKHLKMRPRWVKGKPRVRATLDHLDLAASAPLEPPWPDVIVTVGRRMTAPALWVREQSAGHTRIVLIGKPSYRIDPFALIIVSSEVQIAPAPNILKIGLPLLRVDRNRVASERLAWAARLDPLPRPLVGMLIGGPTNPFAFTRAVERRLLELASTVIQAGGTPYFTTSPRTPQRTVAALRNGLPGQARLYVYGSAEDNPYHALLGSADGFIVTGDSLSMLVEVAALGRPLGILPLPFSAVHWLDRYRRGGARWLYDEATGTADPVRQRIIRVARRVGLLPRTRDFSALLDRLTASGLAQPAAWPLAPSTGVFPDDLERAAARVRALLADGAPAHQA